MISQQLFQCDDIYNCKIWTDLARLKPGAYFIDYTDITHLDNDKWLQLIQVELPVQSSVQLANLAGTNFSLTPVIKPVEMQLDIGPDSERTILDHLRQSFVRLGIMQPVISQDAYLDLQNLKNLKAIGFIPDTNALNKGTMHWLMSALSEKHISLFPIVVSLITIQNHDTKLKSRVNKARENRAKEKAQKKEATQKKEALKEGDLRNSIRSRTLVYGSLSLLEKCREQYQVLEVDHSLLRYVRDSGGNSDPDQSDVFEDRLLVEAIHEVFRSTRSKIQKRVVTSDILLTRILHAEALPYLYLAMPELATHQTIQSIRYDSIAGKFMGATLTDLLWDLAHVFSSVRLRDSQDQTILSLDAYWTGKSPKEFIGEHLNYKLQMPALEVTDEPELPQPSLQPILATASSGEKGFFSRAAVPPVGLLSVVQLAYAVANEEGLPLEKLLDTMENAPSESIAKNGLEILLRIKVVNIKNTGLFKGANFQIFESALITNDWDALSNIFRNLPAYDLLMQALGRDGSLPEKQTKELKSLLGISELAYSRFCLYLTYLAQAYSDGQSFRDGSQRPEDEIVVEKFRTCFTDIQESNMAPIYGLVTRLADTLHIAPPILTRKLSKLVEENRLTEFIFLSAASPRPFKGSPTLNGPLTEARIEENYLDRLQLGQTPVFMVKRT